MRVCAIGTLHMLVSEEITVVPLRISVQNFRFWHQLLLPLLLMHDNSVISLTKYRPRRMYDIYDYFRWISFLNYYNNLCSYLLHDTFLSCANQIHVWCEFKLVVYLPFRTYARLFVVMLWNHKFRCHRFCVSHENVC